eukprot:scaffold237304_cov28-Tisochrysis_lutea.AAC.2
MALTRASICCPPRPSPFPRVFGLHAPQQTLGRVHASKPLILGLLVLVFSVSHRRRQRRDLPSSSWAVSCPASGDGRASSRCTGPARPCTQQSQTMWQSLALSRPTSQEERGLRSNVGWQAPGLVDETGVERERKGAPRRGVGGERRESGAPGSPRWAASLSSLLSLSLLVLSLLSSHLGPKYPGVTTPLPFLSTLFILDLRLALEGTTAGYPMK